MIRNCLKLAFLASMCAHSQFNILVTKIINQCVTQQLNSKWKGIFGTELKLWMRSKWPFGLNIWYRTLPLTIESEGLRSFVLEIYKVIDLGVGSLDVIIILDFFLYIIASSLYIG
jgi:hypothetical protein